MTVVVPSNASQGPNLPHFPAAQICQGSAVMVTVPIGPDGLVLSLLSLSLSDNHHPVRILPARDRVNRRKSIYLSTRMGNLLRDGTAPQVDSGHEPQKRFVPCCRDNRAELSPTLTVQINYRVLKPTTNPLRDARWRVNKKKG